MNNCFELYGVDVMLDSKLRCWLLEINTGPALNTPTPLDKKVKNTVVTDMFHIVGFSPVDKKKHERDLQTQRHNRLTGIDRPQPPVQHRDVRKAESLSFEHVKDENLPSVIQETEAERRRCLGRSFERVFPRSDSPESYHKYFEVQRYNNIIVKRYYVAEKKKALRRKMAAASLD